MTDTKALADRIEQDQGTWEDITEAARILRDVHEWHQNVKAFGLHSKSAMGTAHRLEAALDALEKDDE